MNYKNNIYLSKMYANLISTFTYSEKDLVHK
jgi:hypothetical protein